MATCKDRMVWQARHLDRQMEQLRSAVRKRDLRAAIWHMALVREHAARASCEATHCAYEVIGSGVSTKAASRFNDRMDRKANRAVAMTLRALGMPVGEEP